MIKAAKFLDYVFWDVISHTPEGNGRKNYSLHAIDVATSHHWIFLLKKRSEALQKVKDWKRAIELCSGGIKVKTLGFDNASEFTSDTITDWVLAEGVNLRYSSPYNAQQNGKIERAGRLLTEAARAICIETKLPEFLWPFFMEAAVYINNRLPTRSNEGSKSPMKAMYEAIDVPYTPYIQHIRTWGCIAYVRIPDQKRVRSQKMAPWAQKGQLVGMVGNRGHIYKVWLPKENKVVRAREVRFHEVSLTNNCKEELIFLKLKLF